MSSNTKQRRIEQIPSAAALADRANHHLNLHIIEMSTAHNREMRRMQETSRKKNYAQEVQLAQAAERDARDAVTEAQRDVARMNHLLALVADLLPWRDFTAALPVEKRQEFGTALVMHWRSKGIPYNLAVANVDMWWNCPTCCQDINAGPEGEHVYCEYAHTP